MIRRIAALLTIVLLAGTAVAGVAAATADGGSVGTAAIPPNGSNQTAGNGTATPAPGGQQSSEPPAETAVLAIEQPHYVREDVTERTDSNGTVYSVRGPSLTIQPRNFNTSQVVDSGVAGAGAEQAALVRDRQFGGWEFRARTNGSFTVYWVVAEPRVERQVVDDANATANRTTERVVTVERVRYEARINVSYVDVAHVQSDQLQRDRERAANWSELVATIKEIAGADANVEAQLQDAVNFLRVRNNPTRALTGDLGAILTLLALSLSGLVLVGLVVLVWLATRYADIKYLRQRQQADATLGGVEERLDEYYSERALRTLESWDWTDVFESDAVAREMREHLAETPLDGFLKLYHSVLPSTLVRDRLIAMGHSGWVAEVSYADADGDTDAATDGGDRPIESVALVRERDLPDGTDVGSDPTLRDLRSPSDALVAAVDWDDDRLQAFDLASADVPREAQADLQGPDVDALAERFVAEHDALDESDPGVYAEYLEEFLQAVERSEFVTPEGRVDRVRHALNLLLRVDRQLDEQVDAPFAGHLVEHVELALGLHDPEAEVEAQLDRLELGVDAGAGTGADAGSGLQPDHDGTLPPGGG